MQHEPRIFSGRHATHATLAYSSVSNPVELLYDRQVFGSVLANVGPARRFKKLLALQSAASLKGARVRLRMVPFKFTETAFNFDMRPTPLATS